MKKFIILADDDFDDAELFEAALLNIEQAYFYHAENSQAVFEFLDHQQQTHYGLIFLDINMPEIDGWQCLIELKRHPTYKNIPVIMYSTTSNPNDKEIALNLGALGLITKPTEFNQLKKTIAGIAMLEHYDRESVSSYL